MNLKRNTLICAAIAVLGGALLFGATITTVPALPDSGGVFTYANHDAINAASTTINTNFANINTILGAATGAPTGTGSAVLSISPTLTGSPNLGVQVDCASTAACPSTARATRIVQGIGLLATGSPSTYAVTAISPAFTGATTYSCYAQDVSVIATNIGVLTAGYVSGSAVTFTGPNTTTDTFRFQCIGY